MLFCLFIIGLLIIDCILIVQVTYDGVPHSDSKLSNVKSKIRKILDCSLDKAGEYTDAAKHLYESTDVLLRAPRAKRHKSRR